MYQKTQFESSKKEAIASNCDLWYSIKKGETMGLKIYLVKHRIKIKDFAEMLGCSRTHLGEIMNGRRKIGNSLAQLIELKTNGEVKAEDLLKGE